MGRVRSHEFMEYVSVIMNAICENERLVELLTPDEKLEGLSSEEKKEIFKKAKQYLPYKYLLPYELVTGTLTERARFLGFEISATYDDRQKIYKNMTIDFFVISHQELIQYKDPDMKGYYRRWYDLVVCELDDMFCGDNKEIKDENGKFIKSESLKLGEIGVGKIVLKSNEPYFVSYAREIPYKGRTIQMVVQDFQDGKKYGK